MKLIDFFFGWHCQVSDMAADEWSVRNLKKKR